MLLAAAGIAYVTAVVLALAARRWVVPMWVFEVLAALGTILVTIVVIAGGANAAGG